MLKKYQLVTTSLSRYLSFILSCFSFVILLPCICRRLIGIRMCESKCLFSGSHGEVCSLEPLLTSQLIADHPLKGMIIAAMASFSKVC